MATAKEICDEQRKYDMLHHIRRASILKKEGHLNSFDRGLLKQSLMHISDGVSCYNSVDMEDSEQVGRLDQYGNSLTVKEHEIMVGI